MKKLIIIVLIIVLINVLLNIFVILYYRNSFAFKDNLPDTINNKLLIDSIQHRINTFDSSIYKINIYEETILKKVNSLNNDSSVWLFKSLVTNDTILYGGDK